VQDPEYSALPLDMNSLQNSTSGSPASALRELFREKPPEITRKITACVACRKQKVRLRRNALGRDTLPSSLSLASTSGD